MTGGGYFGKRSRVGNREQAAASRRVSRGNTQQGGMVQTDFQKVSPSRSHSFKRLSSSASVLFLPSVPPSLPGPEVLVLQKNRPNCCHCSRRSWRRGGREKKTAGEDTERKGSHSWLHPGLKRPSDKLLERRKPANGSQQRLKKENLLLPAWLLDFTVSVQLLFELHRYCSIICAVFIVILVPSGKTKHFIVASA